MVIIVICAESRRGGEVSKLVLGSDNQASVQYRKEKEQLKTKHSVDIELLEKENERLKRINTLLEECRAFYGDKNGYWRIPVGEGMVQEPIQDGDKGEFARETAKQIDKIMSERLNSVKIQTIEF